MVKICKWDIDILVTLAKNAYILEVVVEITNKMVQYKEQTSKQSIGTEERTWVGGEVG